VPLNPGQAPTPPAAGQGQGGGAHTGINIMITPGQGAVPMQPGQMPQWRPPVEPEAPQQQPQMPQQWQPQQPQQPQMPQQWQPQQPQVPPQAPIAQAP